MLKHLVDFFPNTVWNIWCLEINVCWINGWQRFAGMFGIDMVAEPLFDYYNVGGDKPHKDDHFCMVFGFQN